MFVCELSPAAFPLAFYLESDKGVQISIEANLKPQNI